MARRDEPRRSVMGHLGPGAERASDDRRGPHAGPGVDVPAGLPHPLGPAEVPAPDANEIVDILSHELRSPITTIHLGAKMLLASGADIAAPVRAEVVEAVEEEAERLYRLVENLLAVARHEGGSNPLPLRPLLLQHWVVGVIEGEVRADRGLRVRTTVPADLPPVLADDGALAQVLRNLLLNAARYAPDGMPVEVVTRRPDERSLEIVVLDRGPGFDPAERELLFEPFYRSPSVTALGSGAGLGLTAARRLMRAMGGELEADVRQDGGSRFVVRLTVADEDDADDDRRGVFEAA
jgi:two-component system sensor histidine kinase KdpD